MRAGSPKRDTQGTGPLGGCGQSPPFPPRDGCVDSAASWSAGRHASVPRARRKSPRDRQNVPKPCFLPRHTMIRRATQQRLCPRRGKQRRIRTPAAPLAPPGQGSVAQRAAGGRLLLVSLPPSAPAPAANGTHRSLSAPGAWGRQASPPRQRRCPPALPPCALGRHTVPSRCLAERTPRLPKTAAGGRPLLVSLPPPVPAPAANGTRRSLSAPGAWGRQASPPRQRRCPPALPPCALGRHTVPSRCLAERTPRLPKTAAGDRLLLVSLPPSAPVPAANRTHRSLPAPGAWGRKASPPRQRRCPPALPA